MEHEPKNVDIMSREQKAGYDPTKIRRAKILTLGVGALGGNSVHTLGLLGIDQRIIDDDTVDPSGVTRTPLFHLADVGTPKARLAAERAIRLSPFPETIIGYAVSRMEHCGYGAFEDIDVVISAVDSLAGRAFLAGITRELGIPLVEAGFGATRLHVTVFPNRADDPCLRCFIPSASSERASCTLYAKEVMAAGYLPATQPVAAVAANLVAEAAIAAIHGTFPLANQYVELDIRTGDTTSFALNRRAGCAGVHVPLPPPVATTVRASDMARDLLGSIGPDVRILLRDTYVVAAPCAACGRRVEIGKPLTRATVPTCGSCGSIEAAEAARASGVDLEHLISGEGSLADLPLSRFGFMPRDIVTVLAGTERIRVRLAGSVDDIFSFVRASDVTPRGAAA